MQETQLRIDGVQRERSILEFDLSIAPQVIHDEDTEVVIRVNGKQIRRMSVWQARRMGLAL